jgi:hypothetical protein
VFNRTHGQSISAMGTSDKGIVGKSAC